ncbi:MAG: hypothetical protein C0631_02785 [Sedimenticola sp.]|nr:MAG: hypothetical protein C0631_02785 [Sedimenticola sp.]
MAKQFLALFALLLVLPHLHATGTIVPMVAKTSKTFYVSGQLSGMGATDFMVDTGSGYLTINEITLKALQAKGTAQYLRDMTGVLANGDELVVPVYLLSAINLGGRCQLSDVEAAVFPGVARQILGMSALKKASPFLFSVDPPLLQLSNCQQQLTKAEK